MLFLFTVVLISSCVKDDKWKDFQTFDATYPVCGQYQAYWLFDGDTIAGPTTLSLYNTANNVGIWIDDNKQFWQFKVKANLSGSNFSINKGYDLTWDDSTTVTNGSVVDDNIYMELEWKSDPGSIYVCKGKRQTGFEE